ncbi:MAG: hypothetical protein ACR2PO_00995 [Methyloligellaceae bacterium]
MASSITGLLCLAVFALSQAARDAFFGSLFQSVSFLAVAILAFAATVIVFAGWAGLRRPGDIRTLLADKRSFSALNVTNAAAWIAYFFALTHLEPAIVNTLFVGVGPLAVLVLMRLGNAMAPPVRLGRVERAAYAGVLASLVALVFVSILGRSGLGALDFATNAIALLSVVVGGVLVTVSHMIARRFSDRGVGSDAVLGMRFLLAAVLAIACELAFGQPSLRPAPDAIPWIAGAVFVLIVIPSYFLQLGITRASPLAVNVMRSLGPVFVFAAQQLDGRLTFSGPTLACILVFAACTLLSSVARGRAEIRAQA